MWLGSGLLSHVRRSDIQVGLCESQQSIAVLMYWKRNAGEYFTMCLIQITRIRILRIFTRHWERKVSSFQSSRFGSTSWRISESVKVLYHSKFDLKRAIDETIGYLKWRQDEERRKMPSDSITLMVLRGLS